MDEFKRVALDILEEHRPTLEAVGSDCEECATWGRTITREENPSAIPCPKCKRLTWPNLGVNCPAGCAASFGAANLMRGLSRQRKGGEG